MSASHSQRSCRCPIINVKPHLLLHSINKLTGNFRALQIFTFFEGRAVIPKIKTSPRTGILHAKLVGGCMGWFFGIETPRIFVKI